MEKAFENGDYNAWKTLMDGKGAIRIVNAENFNRFAEAHKLTLEGKTDEAKAIRAELGLGQKNGEGNGFGQGKNSAERGQNRGNSFVNAN
jgi:hypothetical protein